MLRTNLLVAFSLLGFISTTTAEEKPKASPGVPPLFRKVFGIDKQPARLILVNRTVRFMPEEVTRKEKRDGMQIHWLRLNSCLSMRNKSETSRSTWLKSPKLVERSSAVKTF